MTASESIDPFDMPPPIWWQPESRDRDPCLFIEVHRLKKYLRVWTPTVGNGALLDWGHTLPDMVIELVPKQDEQQPALREWLKELAEELADDESGDDERDRAGVGWEAACKFYAKKIYERLGETS